MDDTNICFSKQRSSLDVACYTNDLRCCCYQDSYHYYPSCCSCSTYWWLWAIVTIILLSTAAGIIVMYLRRKKRLLGLRDPSYAPFDRQPSFQYKYQPPLEPLYQPPFAQKVEQRPFDLGRKQQPKFVNPPRQQVQKIDKKEAQINYQKPLQRPQRQVQRIENRDIERKFQEKHQDSLNDLYKNQRREE